MLKRLEVYADAGLLSFVCSTIVFVLLSMAARPLLAGSFGQGLGGIISMVGPSALIGTAVAIWATWVLHHRTTLEPMTRDESVRMSWFALAAVVFAAAIVAAWTAIGTTTIALGVVGMVFLLAIAVWLVVDAVRDIFKTREHITIDIVRILALGLLGASLVAGLISPAVPGTDQDVTPYVVIGTAYMTFAALLTYGYDELVSWRKRTHTTHAPLSPSV